MAFQKIVLIVALIFFIIIMSLSLFSALYKHDIKWPPEGNICSSNEFTCGSTGPFVCWNKNDDNIPENCKIPK